VHLALFVHRVDGFDPGLYVLARDRAAVGRLKEAMHPHFEWGTPVGCPADLPLWLLQQGDARALAARLSCGQAIAGDGALLLLRRPGAPGDGVQRRALSVALPLHDRRSSERPAPDHPAALPSACVRDTARAAPYGLAAGSPTSMVTSSR